MCESTEDFWRRIPNARQRELSEMPYKNYLKTPEWRYIRRQVKSRSGGLCEVCMAFASDCHHKTYDRRGRERLTDLIFLCRNCHELFHDKLAEPAKPKGIFAWIFAWVIS